MHDLSVKKEFFDESAPRWLLDTESRSAQISRVLSAYNIPLTAPLLDVGSGAGIFLPFILERNGDAAVITEFDVSHEMLHLACSLHGRHSRVGYVQGDAHHLPFRDAWYRTAMCFSVYPHFQAPSVTLAELHRCLIPGGQLCIMHLMGHEELNEMHRAAGKAVEGDLIPPARELALILANSGFVPYLIEEQSDLYLILARRS